MEFRIVDFISNCDILKCYHTFTKAKRVDYVIYLLAELVHKFAIYKEVLIIIFNIAHFT